METKQKEHFQSHYNPQTGDLVEGVVFVNPEDTGGT